MLQIKKKILEKSIEYDYIESDHVFVYNFHFAQNMILQRSIVGILLFVEKY